MLSIAIPTYNRLALLKQALASAQQQTYSNIEIVVFDNHSIDGTSEYLQDVVQNDHRIRIITNSENIGAIGNVTQIPQYILGEYLLVLCDDDLIEPMLVETAIEKFKEFHDLTLYVSKNDVFFGDDEYQKSNHLKTSRQKIAYLATGEQFIVDYFNRKVQTCWCGVVYRVVTLRKIQGFNRLNSTDIDAMFRCALQGTVFIDNKLLAHYRWSANNDSHTCWKDLQGRFNDLTACYNNVRNMKKSKRMEVAFMDYLIATLFSSMESFKQFKALIPLLCTLRKVYVVNLCFYGILLKNAYRLPIAIFLSKKCQAKLRHLFWQIKKFL